MVSDRADRIVTWAVKRRWAVGKRFLTRGLMKIAREMADISDGFRLGRIGLACRDRRVTLRAHEFICRGHEFELPAPMSGEEAGTGWRNPPTAKKTQFPREKPM
jgi:hypothetical protein